MIVGWEVYRGKGASEFEPDAYYGRIAAVAVDSSGNWSMMVVGENARVFSIGTARGTDQDVFVRPAQPGPIPMPRSPA